MDVNSRQIQPENYSGYLTEVAPDSQDTSQTFEYPPSFPWSCETGGCNCSPMDAMADKQSSVCVKSLPSTTASCDSTEDNPYIEYPFPSPTDTNAIAAQQIKEGLCPLATGATTECVPQLCGENPPCQAFWSLPIEECGDVPCLLKAEDQSSQSPRDSSSPPSRSLPSPAKISRCQSGQISSGGKANSLPAARKPTVGRADNNDDLQHDKKPQRKSNDSKQAHSLVEKRYRENLNAKISELHNALSSTADVKTETETGQIRKSEVLQMAIDYIDQSQLEMRHMTNDINRLNARVKELERVVNCDDYSLLKGFNRLKVIRGQEPNGMNGIGASYELAARSAG